MTGLTIDAGGLIALERRDRRMRLLLDEAQRAGWAVAVPVGPLAQVWRGGPGQALLGRFLSTSDHVEVVDWDAPAARAAGVLCGRTGTSDVVDAAVVLCARGRGDRVVTSDPAGLARLDAGLPLIVL